MSRNKKQDNAIGNMFVVLGSLSVTVAILLLTIGRKIMESYFYFPFILSVLGLCCFVFSFYYFLRKKE